MPTIRRPAMLALLLVVWCIDLAYVNADGGFFDESARQSSSQASNTGKTDRKKKEQTPTTPVATPMSSDEIREFFKRGTTPEDLVWKPGASIALDVTAKKIQFSTDGGALVVQDANGSLHLLAIDECRTLGSFKPEGEIRSLAISPDHRYIAVGDQKAVIYEVATGKPVFTHKVFEGDVTFLSISSDGKQLLGTDKTGGIHRTPLLSDGGTTVALHKEAPGPLKVISCSGDQVRLMLALQDGRSLLIDFATDMKQKPRVWDVNGMMNGATVMSVGHRVVLIERPEGVSILKQDEKAGQLNILKWSPNLTKVSGYRVASDDSRLFAWAPDGTVRMLDLKTSFVGLVSKSPVSRLSMLLSQPVIDVGPECKTMAVHQAGQLSIYHLTVDRSLRRQRFESVISPLLSGKQYESLEELCELVRTQASEDFTEADLFRVMQPKGDDAAISTRETELKNWLKALPSSVYPRMALAEYHFSTAWQHRGRGFADTVTEEGAKLFEEHVEKAAGYLASLKSAEDSPKQYFVLKMRLHTSASDSPDAFTKTVGDILKYCPDYVDAHEAAALYLMPRWHGQPGDLAAYLDQVTKVLGEERGNRIVIGVAQHQLPFYRDDFYEATGLDYLRLKPILEAKLKDKSLDRISRDQVLAVYSGVARRADDIEVVRKLAAEMWLGKWLDRNQDQPGTHRDVQNTFAWLQEKDGPGAIPRSILNNLPPVPGHEDVKFPPLPDMKSPDREKPPTGKSDPPKP